MRSKTLSKKRPGYLSSKSDVYSVVKRILDIGGSIFGFLLILPVFVLIIFSIKLDTPGPVFFLQKRVGKRGKTFMMYKFRSMVANAENILYTNKALLSQYQNNSYKIKDDPRVTRVGKILRKMSLDELPQLINILKGDMALVGPRAYKPDELDLQVRKHSETKDYLKCVLSVKPGLTGVWQTSGRSEIGFKERIALDYEYANKQSVLFDLYLILKTFPVVLKRKGAW